MSGMQHLMVLMLRATVAHSTLHFADSEISSLAAVGIGPQENISQSDLDLPNKIELLFQSTRLNQGVCLSRCGRPPDPGCLALHIHMAHVPCLGHALHADPLSAGMLAPC